MAKFIYEHRPHLYGLLGLATILFTKQSFLFFCSGLLFFGAAVTLNRMRTRYRRRYGMALTQGGTTAG
ncbi:MAG: hypothetical protein JNM39_12760 [Bdellovibrionaceae bacterium]|nr:hypothetical protein [Pseudobdellovibrionaceae bacterium]